MYLIINQRLPVQLPLPSVGQYVIGALVSRHARCFFFLIYEYLL